MANIFSLYGNVFIDNEKANKKLDQTTKKGKTFGSKMGATFKNVGKSALAFSTVAGGALATFGTLSVSSAGDFEKGMSSISTLLSDTGADLDNKLKSYGGSIKELMKETGQGSESLQQGLYQVVSAFGDVENATDILAVASKGAQASGAETIDTVNLLSAVTKGYGDTSQEAVQKASDLAFLTAKLGQTTFPELSNSMGKVIPLASTMKVSQEELFGAMATLTGVTGNTAEVTTQLRGTITGLLQPTADMQDKIEGLGYANGQAMIESLGLQGTLDALKGSVDGNDIAFAKLFGSVEAKNAVLALTGAQAENFTEKTNAMKDAVGTTDEAFQKATNNFDGLKNKLAQNINVMKINLGTKLLPVVMKVFEAIQKNMPAIEQAITQLAPVITMLFSQLLPPLFQLVQNIFPVIVGLINALLPTFIMIINEIMPIFIELINMLMPVFLQIVEMIMPLLLELITLLLPLLEPLLELLVPILANIMAVIEPLMKLLDTILPPLITVLVAFIKVAVVPLSIAIELLTGLISDRFVSVLSSLQGVFEGLKKIFKGIIDFIVGVFTGDWEKAWDGVKQIFEGIVGGLASIFKLPLNLIIDGLNLFIKGLNKIQIPDWVPAVGGKGFNFQLIKKLRVGMDYVPYDEMPAILHKGEAVLTKEEADDYRNNNSNSEAEESVVNYNNTINVDKLVVREEADINKIAEKLLYLQRARRI